MANMNGLQKQRGVVLLVGLIILMAAMAAGLMALFSQRMAAVRREAQTAAALSQAKQALLGYAANAAWWDASARNCVNSTAAGCQRPGELPCPDLHPLGDPNEGQSNNAANTCPANSIGRLPWRTLGIPDLRDGNGERLWYARSDRFRSTARLSVPTGAGPLNPDTAFGQITLRASDTTTFVHTASPVAGTGTGAVAVIIAPGAPLRRNNNIQQDRSVTNYNNAIHFLDCWGTAGCNVEDNANFVSGSATNGFISGPVFSGSVEVVNDRVLSISRDEILAVMNQAVANSIALALEKFYAKYSYLPSPADFSNVNCLGVANLGANCPSVPGLVYGRMPATWGTSPGFWTPVNEALILAAPNNRWFQQNGWREHVIYAIAPACANDSNACSAAGGFLTVNNPPYAAINGRRAVAIVAGAAMTGVVPPQVRANNSDRTNPANYVEEENSIPLDTVFAKRPAGAIQFNDVVATFPR